MPENISTLEKLLTCAKREFLSKGFKNASLRNIAAAAGLTTGAIFGHFKSKNDIFESLVNPVCEQAERMFAALSESHCPPDDLAADAYMKKSCEDLRDIYSFIYNHCEEFRLLLCCAEGSSKSDFVHMIVERDVTRTHAYLRERETKTGLSYPSDRISLHILSDCYINSLLEPIRHGMSYEDAIKHTKMLGLFHAGGWGAVFTPLLSSG